MAVAYLEGGSTYFVHDHVSARRKFTFLHVDYEYAGYNRFLDRNCYVDFDRIFTVSGEVKTSLIHVYPECADRTVIFHNLIDRKEILRKADLPGGFEDAYDGKRILTVGRLTAQKSYETAIDAMKLLKDQGIKVRWYVLGEGELRQKLQQKIDSLGLTEDFVLLGPGKIRILIIDSVICMYMPPVSREKALQYRRPRFWVAPFWYQTAAETGSR